MFKESSWYILLVILQYAPIAALQISDHTSADSLILCVNVFLCMKWTDLACLFFFLSVLDTHWCMLPAHACIQLVHIALSKNLFVTTILPNHNSMRYVYFILRLTTSIFTYEKLELIVNNMVYRVQQIKLMTKQTFSTVARNGAAKGTHSLHILYKKKFDQT